MFSKIIVVSMLAGLSTMAIAGSPDGVQQQSKRYGYSVPMAPEQQQYMLSLVSSLLEALEKDIELGEKDPLFGEGIFFWPKNPRQPAKSKISYRADNFKFQSITVGLSRDGSQGPWHTASFAVHPASYPDGVFDMKLPKAFFASFVFEKAYREQRPNAALAEVNVFVFKLKRAGKSLTLQFDARPDVSSLQDRYPQSFHHLIVSASPAQ